MTTDTALFIPQAEAPQGFDLDDEKIALIKRTIARGATADELALFIEQCKRTGLDPFTRQIYSIRRKQWNNQSRSYEEAQIIQISIDGSRLIADRTRKYAGQVGPWWCGPDGEWVEVWLEDTPPAAAKVGVMRHDFIKPLYSIALYKAYVQTNANGDPVSRWKTDPAGMLAKCAESLALRRAFPHELSGLYTTEEMEQADNPVRIEAQAHEQITEGEYTPALPEKILPSKRQRPDSVDNAQVTEAETQPEQAPEPMTLEQAKAVTDSKGNPYADLEVPQLTYRYNNMQAMLKRGAEPEKAAEYRRKIQAIDLILAERRSDAEAIGLVDKDDRAAKILAELGFPPDPPKPQAQAALVDVPADRFADLKAKAEKSPYTAFWALTDRLKWTKEQAAEIIKRNGGDMLAAFNDLLAQS